MVRHTDEKMSLATQTVPQSSLERLVCDTVAAFAHCTRENDDEAQFLVPNQRPGNLKQVDALRVGGQIYQTR